jgi:predicted AAA+ superfamily ATPase
MDESAFIPRHATNEVIEALTDARIVAILGPRQSGKSTLARSLVERGLLSGFYSLDNDDARDAARLDPRGFLASLTTPAIIDEIQRAPELLLALKARVDMDTTPGQFLLTGSANLTTLRSVRDALPGRVDYVDLWPLSQGEVNRHRERFIDRAFDNVVPMLRDCEIGRSPFTERIAAGGFPDARTRTPRGRSRYFDSYARSIFGRDIHDVATGNPEVTEALLRLIAARSSSLANLAELGRAVGVTEKTVAAHLATLEQLLLVRRHRPWSSNLGKRLVKSPRLFVCDTGLACHLCGYDEARLAGDGEAAGPMFESFVAMELVRQATWSDTRVQILHYRDKDQYEIDVILERGDGTVVGIEVKSRATVHPTDFRSLSRLRDQLGTRFACGIVINTGPDTLPFGDRMWAVPLSGLWTT